MPATKKQRANAEAAFDRLCRALKKRKAIAYNDVGGWSLDYADCYGGFNVEEVGTKTGGVRHPLGDRRMSADEFERCVDFLREAVLNEIVIPKG